MGLWPFLVLGSSEIAVNPRTQAGQDDYENVDHCHSNKLVVINVACNNFTTRTIIISCWIGKVIIVTQYTSDVTTMFRNPSHSCKQWGHLQWTNVCIYIIAWTHGFVYCMQLLTFCQLSLCFAANIVQLSILAADITTLHYVTSIHILCMRLATSTVKTKLQIIKCKQILIVACDLRWQHVIDKNLVCYWLPLCNACDSLQSYACTHISVVYIHHILLFISFCILKSCIM